MLVKEGGRVDRGKKGVQLTGGESKLPTSLIPFNPRSLSFYVGSCLSVLFHLQTIM